MTKSDTPANGRNHQGHFPQGNPGGRGNPYARQVANLRKKVLQVIDEDKMEEIILELFELAKKGNLQAIKVLLQYTLGKPAEAQNPDLVDAEEWDQMKAASEKVFQADRVVGTPELETFLRMARVTRPGIGQEMSKRFVGKLQQDLEAEQAEKKKGKKGKKKAPVAANGSNGHRKKKKPPLVVENKAPYVLDAGEGVAIVDPELEDRLSRGDLGPLTKGFSHSRGGKPRLTNGFQGGESRLTNGFSSRKESELSRNEKKIDLKTLRRLRSLK